MTGGLHIRPSFVSHCISTALSVHVASCRVYGCLRPSDGALERIGEPSMQLPVGRNHWTEIDRGETQWGHILRSLTFIRLPILIQRAILKCCLPLRACTAL